MPPELVPDGEDYASSEDSDFAPDAAPAKENDGTSDEESDAETPAAKPVAKKRKRATDEEAEDAGFENSGDEAIIGHAKRKRAKKAKKGDVIDEDEGGEGGLVKTRSMRAAEKVENKPLASTAAATIDVDAVWQAMISGKPVPSTEAKSADGSILSPNRSLSPESRSLKDISISRKEARSPSTTLTEGPNSMIMIKRSYNFAGKVHSEQKLVPRNSAEAKLFLASQAESKAKATPAPPEPEGPFIKPKRKHKLARRSIFEPIPPEGLPQRTDLHFGVRKDSDLTLVGVAGKDAKKLNTVEKSAMDWAGFVDKEGIADELDAAGKSKGAYKARQEFLARVEQKKVEEDRRARGLPV